MFSALKQRLPTPTRTREPVPLDPSTLHDLLRSQRRRDVIEYLTHNDTPTTVGELAQHVASLEYSKPPEELGAQERKRVYVSLYQSHLPALSDAGVVDFDKTFDPGVDDTELTSRVNSVMAAANRELNGGEA